MIEIEEARRLVLENSSPLPAETVALRAALGRVLAQDVVSADDVPATDNSAMDGFAVRAAETVGTGPSRPVALEIVGESRAGHPAQATLAPGQAIAISTGAVIPAGADAVVRVEDTRRAGAAVELLAAVDAGANVRRAGEDIRSGATVLRPGAPLAPAALGALASVGRSEIACHRRPRLRLVATGDELIGPDEQLRPGAVRNSNSYSIPALAEQAGAEVAGTAIAADTAEATREAIAAALDADVAVICGGVSVGAHDHVKEALLALGVDEIFWRVALKPGRPVWFGRKDQTLVFGLPGNPVSAMVTFVLFARPAIAALSGAAPSRWRTTAKLDADYDKQPGVAHAVRCRLELAPDGWRARPAPHQGSHVLTSMLDADALAIVPADSGGLRAGDRVTIELLPFR